MPKSKDTFTLRWIAQYIPDANDMTSTTDDYQEKSSERTSKPLCGRFGVVYLD